MKIRVNFTYKRQPYEFERELEEFDRNYNDEPYAYFLENCGAFEYGGFEINVTKDAEVNGNLTHEGYVNVFEDWGNVMPDDTIIDCDITFVHEL